MSETVEDYVCHMRVAPDSFPAELSGVKYAFCSEQCRERFLANPHVYIGLPGKKAPKQTGVKVIKQRRLHLAQPLTVDEAHNVVLELYGMMGIKDVSAESDNVSITYDLLEATSEQIEAKLEAIGVRLGGGVAQRLRRAFIHYSEECAVDNIEAKSGACCSKPPV
jgi:YHS domain-containing protein